MEEPRHWNIIKKNYSELVQDIHTEAIVDELYASGVLHDTEKSKIMHCSRPHRRNAALLEVIQTKSEVDYTIFLEALARDHEHLGEKLQLPAEGGAD